MRTDPTDRVRVGVNLSGSAERDPRTTAGLVVFVAAPTVLVGGAVAPAVVITVVAGGAGFVAAAHIARRIGGFLSDPSERKKSRPKTTSRVAGILWFATTVGLAFVAAVHTAASKLFTWAIDAVQSAPWLRRPVGPSVDRSAFTSS